METVPLVERILDSLDRVGAVLRADDWSAGEALGLTPTQANILRYLASRGPVRLQEVAAHLGVSLPTASASVDALERKMLVARRKDATDARALALTLTAEGKATVARLRSQSSRLGSLIGALPETEQAAFLLHLVKLIRGLQVAGAIPVQRLCVTCKYFRPFAHPEEKAPHHCALVNAAFGNRELRIDCGEHEAAAPADQTAIWSVIERGGPPSKPASQT